MKLILSILLLFALCIQNVAATDKKKKGGRFIKKLAGLAGVLLLTTQTNAVDNAIGESSIRAENGLVCPTTLPPYSLDMMNYINCGDKEQTADFYDKYLSINMIKKESCSLIGSLYQKVQNLGRCATKKFTNIVGGAKERLLGKNLDRKTELAMFEEYLQSIDELDDDVVVLYEDFKNLEKPDFFRIKKATALFKKFKGLNTANALKEALKPEYQKLDFDKVERMMPYNFITNYNQIKIALDPRYQTIDFDKADYVRKRLAKYNLHHSSGIEELVKQKNQNLDWDKVIRMIPYAKMLKAQSREQIQEAVKPEYQKLDFDKVDRMLPYAKAMTWHKYHQAKEALDQKYQSFDFDTVDYIYKLLLKTSSTPQQAAWDAVSKKYKNYDISRVQKAFEDLKKLFPNDPKIEAEKVVLEPWIQSKNIDSTKIVQIFKDCKNNKNKNKLPCWVLKSNQFKKSDL